MYKTLLGATALTALCCAHADSPRPAWDWSADRFLIGTWSCEQSRAGRKSGSEKAVYSFGFGGHWLQLVYTFTPIGSKSPSMKTTSYEAFDSSLGKWVYISIASDGDYGTSYSDGWKGNTKTYGPPASSRQDWRLVATKLSQNEFTEEVEAASSNGSWNRTVSLDCRRVVPK